jgi:hypothetical protein
MHENSPARIEWSIIGAVVGLAVAGLAASSIVKHWRRHTRVSMLGASADRRDQSIASEAMIDEGGPAERL